MKIWRSNFVPEKRRNMTDEREINRSGQPLAIERLVKHFGATVAVDDVSLTVGAGECLGLLGPNGAGKSTLIRSIAGRVRPDSGSVAVFGTAGAGDLSAYQLPRKPERLRPLLRAGRRAAAEGHRLVPAMGGARGPAGRAGQKPFRRHEAAAEHGGGNNAPAQGRAFR